MAAADPKTHFRQIAPWLMGKLMADFPLDELDAAAIAGNGGHESKGFTDHQEDKPVVPGSRGGGYWFQWTGQRRRAYEAYCKRNGKDPESRDANYAWLFLELRGAESAAIAAIKAAEGLDAKVIAFERAFLRAGAKHYPSRQAWAQIALDAWQVAGKPPSQAPAPAPVPAPPEPDGIFVPGNAGMADVMQLAGRDAATLAAAATTIALAQAWRQGWRFTEPDGPPSNLVDLVKGLFMETQQKKSVFASKTVWGILIILVSQFSPAAGQLVDLLVDAPQVDPVVADQLTGVIDQIMTAVGGAIALWGRVSATKPVNLTGK